MLLTKDNSRGFRLTEAGSLLREDYPHTLRAMALLEEGPEHYAIYRRRAARREIGRHLCAGRRHIASVLSGILPPPRPANRGRGDGSLKRFPGDQCCPPLLAERAERHCNPWLRPVKAGNPETAGKALDLYHGTLRDLADAYRRGDMEDAGKILGARSK